MLTVRAATLAVALLCLPARAQEGAPRDAFVIEVEEGEVGASDLARRWAERTGKVLTLDPQVDGVRIKFDAAARLDLDTLRQVLDMHDVVGVERDGNLQVHHRRNLNQKVGPPWEFVEGQAPDDDRLITCVTRIQHGAGNSIFATVRGLLTRDTNRIGNILYVQGPEVIIIVDLARNVRFYQQVITALDLPAQRFRTRITVLEAPRAVWARIRDGERTAAARAAALRKAAGENGGPTVLADGTFDGAEPTAVHRRGDLDGDLRADVALMVGAAGVAAGQPGQPVVVVPGSDPDSLLRLSVTLSREGAPELQLDIETRMALGGAAGVAVESFTGRPTTEIVILLERERVQ
jgi:hypothetical protein